MLVLNATDNRLFSNVLSYAPERATRSIGVVQTKGGAGRSTLATNIAGELSKLGTVALIDCDEHQACSLSWAILRNDVAPNAPLHTLQARTPHNLESLVRQVRGRVDWLIFDAPRTVPMTRMVLALTDVALIPMGPSLPEIWALSDLLPHISDVQDFRGDSITVRMVWTRFRSQTRLDQDLASQAPKEFMVKPLLGRLGMRTAYVEALGSGHTAAETSDPLARRETRDLVAEVCELACSAGL